MSEKSQEIETNNETLSSLLNNTLSDAGQMLKNIYKNSSKYLYDKDDTWTELDDYHVDRIVQDKDHAVWSTLSEDDKNDPEKIKAIASRYWYNETSKEDHDFYHPGRTARYPEDEEVEDSQNVLSSNNSLIPKIDIKDPKYNGIKFSTTSGLSLDEQYQNKINEDYVPSVSYQPPVNLWTANEKEIRRQRNRARFNAKEDTRNTMEVLFPEWYQEYTDAVSKGELPSWKAMWAELNKSAYQMAFGDILGTVGYEMFADKDKTARDHLYKGFLEVPDHKGYHLVKTKNPEQFPFMDSANLHATDYVPVDDMDAITQSKVIDALLTDPTVMSDQEYEEAIKVINNIYGNGYRLYDKEGMQLVDPIVPTKNADGTKGRFYAQPDPMDNPKHFALWEKYNKEHTFTDVLADFGSNPSQFLPWIGSVNEGADLYQIYQTAEKINNGVIDEEQLTEKEALLLYEWLVSNAHKGNDTFMAGVAKTIFDMIPFMGEFYLARIPVKIFLSGGKSIVGAITSDAVQSMVSKKLGKKITKNVTVGKVLEETISLAGSNFIMNELPVPNLETGEFYSKVEADKIKFLMPGFSADPLTQDLIYHNAGEDEISATKMARVNQYVETLSESTGKYIFGPMFNQLGKNINKYVVQKSAFLQALLKKNPIEKFPGTQAQYKSNIKAYLASAGLDGILEEMLEEEVGRGARHMFHVLSENGLTDPAYARAGWEWQTPTAEEYMQQLIAFSFLPGVTATGGVYENMINKRFAESETGKLIIEENKSTDQEIKNIEKKIKDIDVSVEESETEEDTDKINEQKKEVVTELNDLKNKKEALLIAEMMLRNNPHYFDSKGILEIINEVKDITIDDLKARGMSMERIEKFWKGEDLPGDTKIAQILGSTEWKELENDLKVLIRLYTGSKGDTVIEEMYGFAYRNMTMEERSLWDEYFKSQDTELTSQEFFEKQGKTFYMQEKLYKRQPGLFRKLFQKPKDILKNIFNLHKDNLDPRIRQMYINAGLLKPLAITNFKPIKVAPLKVEDKITEEQDVSYSIVKKEKLKVEEIDQKLANEWTKGKVLEWKSNMTDEEKKNFVQAMVDYGNHIIDPDDLSSGWWNTHISKVMKNAVESGFIPELEDEDVQDVFKAVLSITSLNTQLVPNHDHSMDVIMPFIESGDVNDLRRRKPSGKQYGMPVLTNNLNKYVDFVKHFGSVEKLRTYLLTPAPVKEINDLSEQLGYSRNVSGDATDLKYPALILGPKIGEMYTALHGIEGTAPLDLWINRWMEVATGDIVLDKDGKLMDAPRNDSIRNLMIEAILNIQKDLNEAGYDVDYGGTQASIWVNMMNIFENVQPSGRITDWGKHSKEYNEEYKKFKTDPSTSTHIEGFDEGTIRRIFATYKATTKAEQKTFQETGRFSWQGNNKEISYQLVKPGNPSQNFYDKTYELVRAKLPNKVTYSTLQKWLINNGISLKEIKMLRLPIYIEDNIENNDGVVDKNDLLKYLVNNQNHIDLKVLTDRMSDLSIGYFEYDQKASRFPDDSVPIKVRNYYFRSDDFTVSPGEASQDILIDTDLDKVPGYEGNLYDEDGSLTSWEQQKTLVESLRNQHGDIFYIQLEVDGSEQDHDKKFQFLLDNVDSYEISPAYGSPSMRTPGDVDNYFEIMVKVSPHLELENYNDHWNEKQKDTYMHVRFTTRYVDKVTGATIVRDLDSPVGEISEKDLKGFHQASTGYGQYADVYTYKGKDVIAIHTNDRGVIDGFAVHPDFQNKGVATAFLTKEMLDPVFPGKPLLIQSPNEEMLKAMKKVGDVSWYDKEEDVYQVKPKQTTGPISVKVNETSGKELVMFIEEIQSDYEQQVGAEKSFLKKVREHQIKLNKLSSDTFTKEIEDTPYNNYDYMGLGVKVAIKMASRLGLKKIYFTTGREQNLQNNALQLDQVEKIEYKFADHYFEDDIYDINNYDIMSYYEWTKNQFTKDKNGNWIKKPGSTTPYIEPIKDGNRMVVIPKKEFKEKNSLYNNIPSVQQININDEKNPDRQEINEFEAFEEYLGQITGRFGIFKNKDNHITLDITKKDGSMETKKVVPKRLSELVGPQVAKQILSGKGTKKIHFGNNFHTIKLFEGKVPHSLDDAIRADQKEQPGADYIDSIHNSTLTYFFTDIIQKALPKTSEGTVDVSQIGIIKNRIENLSNLIKDNENRDKNATYKYSNVWDVAGKNVMGDQILESYLWAIENQKPIEISVTQNVKIPDQIKNNNVFGTSRYVYIAHNQNYIELENGVGVNTNIFTGKINQMSMQRALDIYIGNIASNVAYAVPSDLSIYDTMVYDKIKKTLTLKVREDILNLGKKKLKELNITNSEMVIENFELNGKDPIWGIDGTVGVIGQSEGENWAKDSSGALIESREHRKLRSLLDSTGINMPKINEGIKPFSNVISNYQNPMVTTRINVVINNKLVDSFPATSIHNAINKIFAEEQWQENADNSTLGSDIVNRTIVDKFVVDNNLQDNLPNWLIKTELSREDVDIKSNTFFNTIYDIVLPSRIKKIANMLGLKYTEDNISGKPETNTLGKNNIDWSSENSGWEDQSEYYYEEMDNEGDEPWTEDTTLSTRLKTMFAIRYFNPSIEQTIKAIAPETSAKGFDSAGDAIPGAGGSFEYDYNLRNVVMEFDPNFNGEFSVFYMEDSNFLEVYYELKKEFISKDLQLELMDLKNGTTVRDVGDSWLLRLSEKTLDDMHLMGIDVPRVGENRIDLYHDLKRPVLEIPEEKIEEIQEGAMPSFQLMSKEKEILNNENSFDLSDATHWQYFLHGIQDEMIRMKVIQEDIGNLSENLDVYMQNELSPGATAEKVEIFRKWWRDIFLKKLNDEDIGVQDFGDYLYFTHARERNNYVFEKQLNKIKELKEKKKNASSQKEKDKIQRQLDKMPFDQVNFFGSGKSIEEIEEWEAWFDSLPEEKQLTYEDLAGEFDENVIVKMRTMLLESGLIDQEAFDALESTFEYYVPLKGIEGQDTYSGIARGDGVKSSGIKRISDTGRSTSANNPFAQALADMEQLIARIEKNKTYQTLYDLVNASPHSMWSTRGMRYMPQYDEFGNMQLMPTDKDLKGNEVAVRIDGKTKIIEINDPLLLESFKRRQGSSNEWVKSIVSKLNTFNSFFRSVNTSLRVTFVINNFIRDAQTAGINMTEELGLKEIAKVYKGVFSAVRGIYRSSRGKKTKWSKWYNEFKEDGGKVGWMDQTTVEEKLDDIQYILSALDGNHKVKEGFYHVGRFIEDMNMSVENGVRLMVYKSMREQGKSREKSAQFAKNLTVNFNKKGAWGPMINTLYVFSNAGIQGNARLIGGFARNKYTRRAMYGLTVMGFWNAFLQRLIDPEDWDALDKWKKDNKFQMQIPGMKKNNMSIQLGYGINVPHAIGVIAEDYLASQEWYQDMFGFPKGSGVTWQEAGIRVIGAMDHGFNPLGGNWEQAWVPTIAKPVVQFATNEDWKGSAYKKTQNYFNQPDKHPHTMYFDYNVHEINKDATKGLFDKTGISINPADIDHFIRGYGGGLSKDIVDGIDMGYNYIKNNEFPYPENVLVFHSVLQTKKAGGGTKKIHGTLHNKREIHPFNEQEIHRYYRTGKKAVEQGYMTQKQFNKNVKQFRKKQYELTGEWPPHPDKLGYKLKQPGKSEIPYWEKLGIE